MHNCWIEEFYLRGVGYASTPLILTPLQCMSTIIVLSNWGRGYINSACNTEMIVASHPPNLSPCTINEATVNREYFDVKIFSDSLACAKIKCTKIHAQY